MVSTPGAELVAVCADDPRQLERCTGRAGQPGRPRAKVRFHRRETSTAGYPDLLADAEVEAVDICLPTWLHEERAVAALRAGKHVMVEKPMALTARRARAA